MKTNETVNATNDVFSDHEPSWNPDGTAIVFHSDRGNFTTLGRFRTDNFQMIDHDYSQFDVYMLQLNATEVERLTFNEMWDERSAKFGGDPEKLLFISDRNGIPNLYEKDLASGKERPLTDVLIGIIQVSLSADGNKAAIVSLREGTPSIYMLKTPFLRTVENEVLSPNVWAQRVDQDGEGVAPAIALASKRAMQRNPLLRDASDGVPFDKGVGREPEQTLASRSPAVPLPGGGSVAATDDELESGEGESRDTTSAASDPGRIDFRNYVFSNAFEEESREERIAGEIIDPFEVTDNVDEEGNFKEKAYKLTFSPDIIYGSAGYDALYGGVQGVTQMMFSDVLGNHQIYASTNLLIDLRNSNYFLQYAYLAKRIDYSINVFHVSQILTTNFNTTYFRFRNWGVGTGMSVPLDKFQSNRPEPVSHGDESGKHYVAADSVTECDVPVPGA